MDKKTYQLIALDMDGTLLTSDHHVSKGCRDAIKAAKEQGKYAVLSTGRNLDELKDNKKELCDVPFYICESGALLYDCKTKERLFHVSIPEEIVKEILDIVEKYDAMPYLASNGETVVERCRHGHMTYFNMGKYEEMLFRQGSVIIDCSMKEYYEKTLCSVEKFNIFCASTEVRETLFAHLTSLNLPITMVYSEIASIEISPLGVSKGLGLKKLCEHLGISIEESIAVGDADNDMEILKTAGLSVAMGNAAPYVKEVCDVIVADNDHDGCKEAIETYLLD